VADARAGGAVGSEANFSLLGCNVMLGFEELPFGIILQVGASETCRVRLDDGRELSDVGIDAFAREFYELVPGERVCVSLQRGKQARLTGYLD
jgi:hypothetical protein